MFLQDVYYDGEVLGRRHAAPALVVYLSKDLRVVPSTLDARLNKQFMGDDVSLFTHLCQEQSISGTYREEELEGKREAPGLSAEGF